MDNFVLDGLNFVDVLVVFGWFDVYEKCLEVLETNLMSLVIFITLNICSTCFEH
jgi:hypothetical protein